MVPYRSSVQLLLIFAFIVSQRNTIFETPVVEAHLVIEPIWNDSDATSCGLESNQSNGRFILQGDPNHICSADLNVSSSTSSIQISLPMVKGYFEFWIERLGVLLRRCQFRYEFVRKQDTTCDLFVHHGHTTLNFQGNITLSLKEVPNTGARPVNFCANNINNNNNNTMATSCSEVPEYNEILTCTIHQDKDLLYRRFIRTIPTVCKFEFKSHCDSALQDYRKVTFICSNNGSVEGRSKRIVHDTNAAVIDLTRNNLTSIAAGSFLELTNVITLDLSFNTLVTLSSGIFRGLEGLKSLHLSNSLVRAIDEDVFQDVLNLFYIFLDRNNLTVLPNSIFHGLLHLKQILLQRNRLNFIQGDLFRNLSKLESVQMAVNKLSILDENIFQGLTNLRALGLANNLLTALPPGIFKGLVNLESLYLGRGNPFVVLDIDIFEDLRKLIMCEIRGGRLQTIPDVKHLGNLKVFDIEDNPLKGITRDTFAEVPIGTRIIVSQHEICECYVDKESLCSPTGNRSPYLTCDRLLSDKVLVVFTWLIGLNALCGNLLVLVLKHVTKSQRNLVQDRLLTNLALSDLLMGVYMVAIAATDAYFGKSFPINAESWRASITCRVSGAISIISSEASVFFVTLISIDRFMNMQFPYSLKRFGKKSVVVLIITSWVLALVLGVVPSSLAGINYKFYDNSHVCIGLPLALLDLYSSEKREIPISFGRIQSVRRETVSHFQGQVNGLYFSTTVFLGLNGLCYFVILFCYTGIVRAVRKSARSIRNTQEMKNQLRLTSKVAAIVATDSLCWFPVIVLGILVQCRIISLPASVFAWLVTFVIPINSAINPYLYTISALVGRIRKTGKDHSSSDKKVKTGDSSKVTTVSSAV